MGYRGDYILTKHAPADIAASLDLKRIGDIEDVPENVAWLGQMPNGWTVFVPMIEGYCTDLFLAIAAMSEDADVVTCSVNETVMASEAIGFRDGLESWRIACVTDSKPDEKALNESGNLPEEARQVLASILSNQDQDDKAGPFFEYPIRVAEAVTGYCYDALYSSDDFEVMYIVQVPLQPHVRTGFISRQMEVRPIATILLSFLLLLIGAGAAVFAVELLLEPLIAFVLGDLADVCLLNCKPDESD